MPVSYTQRLDSGELLYGVLFTRGGLDGQGAADCAQALVEMARARYGAPETYPIDQTDKSAREYWYFCLLYTSRCA